MNEDGLTKGKLLKTKKDRRRELEPLTPEERKLVEDNLIISKFAARRAITKTRGHTGCFKYEDLVGIAHHALCVAAKDFDPKRGFKFSTYASRKAEGYIQHALRDYSRLVRIPRFVYSYRDKVRDLTAEGYTTEEISEILGISKDKIVDCNQSWEEIHFSVDTAYSDGEESRSFEIPCKDPELSKVIIKGFLNEISKLPPNIIDMLNCFHYEDAEGLSDWEKDFCNNFFKLYRNKINKVG